MRIARTREAFRRKPDLAIVFRMEDAAIDYQKGLSLSQASAKHSISAEGLRWWMQRHGLERRPPGRYRAFDKEETKEIMQKYNDGMTLRGIAEEFKSHPDTIKSVLRKAGRMTLNAPQTRRRQMALLDERFKEPVLKLYNEGLSQKEIAHQLHTGLLRIRRIVRKWAMKQPRRKQVPRRDYYTREPEA